MPAYVSVRVKTFANHCPDKVRISLDGDICARRVERHRKGAGRSGIQTNRLAEFRDSIRVTRRTNSVKLQIAGQRIRGVWVCVFKVRGFDINVALKVYLKMHVRIHRDACLVPVKVARNAEGNVGVRASRRGIHRQHFREV